MVRTYSSRIVRVLLYPVSGVSNAISSVSGGVIGNWLGNNVFDSMYFDKIGDRHFADSISFEKMEYDVLTFLLGASVGAALHWGIPKSFNWGLSKVASRRNNNRDLVERTLPD